MLVEGGVGGGSGRCRGGLEHVAATGEDKSEGFWGGVRGYQDGMRGESAGGVRGGDKGLV